MGPAMATIAADIAENVIPANISGGHFLVEEEPDQVARPLLGHLDTHR